MELPQVGKHCQLQGCNSLDFLPVACPLCQCVFCGDHRLPLGHKCKEWKSVRNELVQCELCEQLIKTPENKDAKETLQEHQSSSCQLYLYPENPIKKISRDCKVKGCKDIDPRIGPVHCNGCDHDFCLRHRYPSSHECISLDVDEQKKLDRKLIAQETIAKTFVPKEKAKVAKPALPKKRGGIVELMKIKSQAKGSDSVPLTSRLYLYVECPKESKSALLTLYFDKKNTVGRVLDRIADICKVNNKNHLLPSSDAQRLELYKYPEMTHLNTSDQLESTLQNLDTIYLERRGLVEN